MVQRAASAPPFFFAETLRLRRFAVETAKGLSGK